MKLPAKRKASGLIKTRKPGAFVSTFEEIPNDPDSYNAEGPAEPKEPRATTRDARRPGAGQGPDNTSRAFRDKRLGDRARRPLPVKRRDATSSIPGKRRDVPSSLRNQPRVPPKVLSQSESNVVGKFFSTTRNMEVDEVADTETNPAFSGNLVSCIPSFCWASVCVCGGGCCYRS